MTSILACGLAVRHRGGGCLTGVVEGMAVSTMRQRSSSRGIALAVLTRLKWARFACLWGRGRRNDGACGGGEGGGSSVAVGGADGGLPGRDKEGSWQI